MYFVMHHAVENAYMVTIHVAERSVNRQGGSSMHVAPMPVGKEEEEKAHQAKHTKHL